MAHIKDENSLEKWYRMHQKGTDKKPYWVIHKDANEASNGKGKCWMRSCDDVGYSEKTGESELMEAIRELPSNTCVLIRLRYEPKSSTDMAETHYTHVDLTKSQSNIGGVGRVGFTQEDIEKAVEKALAEAKKEQATEAKFKELELKIQEAKETNWERILENPMVKEAAPHVISGILNLFKNVKPETIKQVVTAAKVAGTNEDEDENEARWEAALAKFATADPKQALELLEKVAEIATNDSLTYSIAKGKVLAL